MPDIPGTINYPAALDTAVSLIQTANNASTTLSASVSNSATTLPVVSSVSFPASGLVSMDSEIVSYTSKNPTNLLGCTRGRDGTTAAAHVGGTAVEGRIVAAHHNTLSSAIVATETKIGIGNNAPTLNSILQGTGIGTSLWTSRPQLNRCIISTGTQSGFGLVTGLLTNELTNWDLRGGMITRNETGVTSVVGVEGVVRSSAGGDGGAAILPGPGGSVQWEFTGLAVPPRSRLVITPYVRFRVGQAPTAVRFELLSSDGVTWYDAVNDLAPVFTDSCWVGPDVTLFVSAIPIRGCRVTLTFAASGNSTYLRELGLFHANTPFGSYVFPDMSSNANAFRNGVNSTTSFQIKNTEGAPLFNADTSNQRIGIGTATPHTPLQVAGPIATAIVTTTGAPINAYTVTASDSIVLANANSNVISINLPSAVGIGGRRYTVKKIDSSANAVTVSPLSPQTIDGASTLVLSAAWDKCDLVSNGTSWFII